mmetsp:Transcript_48080/g.116800  ORF Transcript_48080/g.116800 Transcript_48080/m.116800 type:complete len:692 (+) Transcript_48080:1027-3102(+)
MMSPEKAHSIKTMEEDSEYLVPWKVPSGCTDSLTALTISHALYLLEWKLYNLLVKLSYGRTAEEAEEELEKIMYLFYELEDIELIKCINVEDLVSIAPGSRDMLLHGAFLHKPIQDRDGVDLLPWCVQNRRQTLGAPVNMKSIEALNSHVNEIFNKDTLSDGWTYKFKHVKVNGRLGFVCDYEFYDMLRRAERCRRTLRCWLIRICDNPEKAFKCYRKKISLFAFHHCRTLHRMLHDGNISQIGEKVGIQVEKPTADLEIAFVGQEQQTSLGKAVLQPFWVEPKASSMMGVIAAVPTKKRGNVEYYYICVATAENELDNSFESFITKIHDRLITKVQLDMPDGLRKVFPKHPPGRTGPLQRRPKIINRSRFLATTIFQNNPSDSPVQTSSSALVALNIASNVDKCETSGTSIESIVFDAAGKDDFVKNGLVCGLKKALRIIPTQKRLATGLSPNERPTKKVPADDRSSPIHSNMLSSCVNSLATKHYQDVDSTMKKAATTGASMLQDAHLVSDSNANDDNASLVSDQGNGTNCLSFSKTHQIAADEDDRRVSVRRNCTMGMDPSRPLVKPDSPMLALGQREWLDDGPGQGKMASTCDSTDVTNNVGTKDGSAEYSETPEVVDEKPGHGNSVNASNVDDSPSDAMVEAMVDETSVHGHPKVLGILNRDKRKIVLLTSAVRKSAMMRRSMNVI